MKSLLAAFALVTAATAYIGEICGDSAYNYGVCEDVSWCTENAATKGEPPNIISGFCPNDPDDVKCCLFPYCGGSGICVDTSTWDCSGAGGRLVPTECPGPNNYEVKTLLG